MQSQLSNCSWPELRNPLRHAQPVYLLSWTRILAMTAMTFGHSPMLRRAPKCSTYVWLLRRRGACVAWYCSTADNFARNTTGRAQIIAKILQTIGRTDVAVGVGPATTPYVVGPEYPWAQHYDLGAYPGTLRRDGVQAMVEELEKGTATCPVCVLELAPATNLGLVLKQRTWQLLHVPTSSSAQKSSTTGLTRTASPHPLLQRMICRKYVHRS